MLGKTYAGVVRKTAGQRPTPSKFALMVFRFPLPASSTSAAAMAHVKDHLSDLDRHVQLLEGKVNKLRASLKHWQQWYFDYSALKEEVDQLPLDPPPRKELARIRRDFSSELITQKEINEIFGKNDLKDTKQILTVISRRLDYGEQNVQSLTKMLQAEENRLSAATVIAHPDGGTDEETGLPLTDIIEELDGEGNVVSFRLQTGSDAGSQIAAALEKAGVDNLTETGTPTRTPKDHAFLAATSGGGGKEEEAATPSKAVGPPSNAKPEEVPAGAQTSKKSVSFANDTKTGDKPSKPPIFNRAQRVEDLMRIARESEATDFSKAVIPENESPEDRELRQQMLDYCGSEMGPVVAELQIEEGETWDEDDDWDMSDEGPEDYRDEDEDELGRSKHSVITVDYIKRMQKLEKRLQSQSAFASSRQQADSTVAEGVERGHVVREQEPEPAITPYKAPCEAKSVRFASALNIAAKKNIKPRPSANSKPTKEAQPVKDIVDKSLVSDAEDLEDEQPKRVSRFKKERVAVSTKSGPATNFPPGPLQLRPSFLGDLAGPVTERSEPAPPEVQTLAAAIVERNVSSSPAEPNDMDDVLLYQAAAVEYNRLRNRMIQQQGGFLKEEESPVIPLDEDEGSAPRVSRFKAARLSKN